MNILQSNQNTTNIQPLIPSDTFLLSVTCEKGPLRKMFKMNRVPKVAVLTRSFNFLKIVDILNKIGNLHAFFNLGFFENCKSFSKKGVLSTF